MQLLTIDGKTAKRLFWSIATGAAILMLLTTAQTSPLLVAGSLVLCVVGAYPLYMWLIGSSYGLPIWPAFSAYSSAFAAMPVLQVSKSLESYSDTAILGGLAVMAGFLALGSLVWLAMTAKVSRPPKTVFMLEPGSAVQALFWCVVVGVVFQANAFAGWFVLPGNTMQIFRGIAGGLSCLGVFALAYFHGAGLLTRFQVPIYLGLFVALVLVALTGLMLAAIIPLLALLLIGFTLGAGRVPWFALAGVFAGLALLHAGKYQMREKYFDDEGKRQMSMQGVMGLPAVYSEWIASGFETLGNVGNAFGRTKNEEAPSTIFERAGNLHMLLLVLDKTPVQVPYLNGITYEPIPKMLIPRFLAPEKSISHVGNVILSVNYGLLDEEGARRTSIGWSLVAEAYANFGYLGVCALAVLLSALYSTVARLSSGVPITSFRFISGLIVLAGVTNENSLGVFITMQFQGIVGVALASVLLMRRHANPLYTERRDVAVRLRDPQTERSKEGLRHDAGGMTQPNSVAPPQVEGPAKWGGHRPPKWAPLSHRKAYELAAARRRAEAASVADEQSKDVKQKAERPRQVAVPIQPYYYRSRKA